MRVNPGLCHCNSWWVILVEKLTPGSVNLMHLVPIKEWVGAIGFHYLQREGFAIWERLEVFLESVSYIDAIAIYSTIRPELQGLEKILVHLWVIPIEVRLLLCE
jgi:hypothetical protein